MLEANVMVQSSAKKGLRTGGAGDRSQPTLRVGVLEAEKGWVGMGQGHRI